MFDTCGMHTVPADMLPGLHAPTNDAELEPGWNPSTHIRLSVRTEHPSACACKTLFSARSSRHFTQMLDGSQSLSAHSATPSSPCLPR